MDRSPFYTMDDFDFNGKRVYLRIDINSPINPITGEVVDDTRFLHYLKTINELKNSKVVIIAHQGRPGDSDFVSLRQHAGHLGRLLGRDVSFVDSLIGSEVETAIRNMKNGDIIMLENSRFYSEEILIKDEGVAQKNTFIVRNLSKLFDYFIIDAFPAIHRDQTTLTGFKDIKPNIAGRLMETEITNIDRFMGSKSHPKLAIMGGAKIRDAIKVTGPFLEKEIVDNIIFGGVAANIFLWASGVDIGKRNMEFIEKQDKNYKKLLEKEIVDNIIFGGVAANIFLWASGVDIGKRNMEFIEKQDKNYKKLLEECKSLLSRFPDRIYLPEDFMLNPLQTEIKIGEKVPDGQLLADIGFDSIKNFSSIIEKAKNIFLNGPMGMYEINEYSLGTREIFNAVSQSPASKIVGGGHTINAINEFGLSDSMGYISTGGGALINYLSGEPIPVIDSLVYNRKKFGGN